MRSVEFRQLEASRASFGLIVDYLSRRAPFDGYPFGQFCQSLRYQLTRESHVAAFDGERMCGYLGWLLTTREIGERWHRGEGVLVPVDSDDCDSGALTVVCVDERALVFPLIRHVRRLNPGRMVYFKRVYADGNRTPRKAQVLNYVPAA